MVEFTIITQHALSLRRWILISVILFSVAVSNGGIEPQSTPCTGQQAATKRNSFNFRKFGNTSNLEECVDFCCRDDTCELAIFSRGFHCFGVSCYEPKLCHKILDRLLMKDERELQRNTGNTGTKDFIRHTSQVANPRCPHRFVPTFDVLLLGTSTPRGFHKLRGPSIDASQCNAQCCGSRDCLLSFIEDDECYGVTGLLSDHNSTSQEGRIGLQVAIVDRNKEVSRSLDDEDEDPDELGSDEADHGSPTGKRVSASLKLQSKPGIPQKENTQLKAKLKSSTNSSRKGISDKKFAEQKYSSRPTKSYEHLTTKSRTRRPSIEDNIHSKLSRQKGVAKQKKTVKVSRGIASRVDTLIAKKTKLNPNVPVHNAPGHSDAVHKVSKMVGSAEAKTKLTAKPTQQSSNATGQRQESQTTPTETNSRSSHGVSAIRESKGAKHIPRQKGRTAAHQRQNSQTAYTDTNSKSARDDVAIRESKGSATHQRQETQATHIEANSKSARDVIAISESKGFKGSRFGKMRHEGDFINSGSASSKKWFSPRFSELRMEEASSHGDESSTGEGDQEFSGVDLNFSGESDLSGDENSSGAFRELSINDNGLSGHDGKVISRDKDVNDVGEDFSSGGSGFSGEDENFSGTDGNLSGNLNNILKISDAAVHPHESTARGKAEGRTGKTVHANSMNLEDSGKSKEERRRPQNKASAEKKNERVEEIKKSDLVEDLDDLGSDDEDSKATSKGLARLPQKGGLSKIAKHGKETHNERLKSKELTKTRKKIDLVEDLDDLGSDDEDSKATSRTVIAELPSNANISKTLKHGKDNQNKRLKSNELGKMTKKIDLVGDIGFGDNGSGVILRKDIGLPKTWSISQAIKHGKSMESGRRLKYKVKKTRKSNVVEDPDDLGSDDDDSKVSPRAFVRLHAKSNIPKATKHDKKTDNEEYLKSKEGGNAKKTDHVEDPDDLGSDDDDTVKSSLEHGELASKKGASLPQITSHAISPISKTTKNETKTGNERTYSKEEGKTRKKIDLLEDLDELGADDNDSFTSKDERRKATSRSAVGMSQRNELVKSPISKKKSMASSKSSRSSVQTKLQEKNTKKASNTFAKEIRKPKDGNNKLKNISTFQSRLNHSKKHGKTKLVKSNENILNESSRKEKESVKANTASLRKNIPRITATEGRKAKHRDKTKQTTTRPLASTTGKHIEQFGIKKISGENIKTKMNGTRLADKNPKNRQSNTKRMKNGVEHHDQPVVKKNHAIGTQSKKGREVFPSSNVEVNHSLKQTENEKMLIQASVNKIKDSLKGRIASTTQGTSTSDATVAKSVLKTNNVKNTFKEPETSSTEHAKKTLNPKKTPLNVKKNHTLGSKIQLAQKKGKIKSLNSSSKLEDIVDLMKYAHLKGSVEHQETVRNHRRSFQPTRKRGKFVKTSISHQQLKRKPNRNKIMQGQPKMPVHPYVTKRFQQKKKSSPEKRPQSQHPPSASLTKKRKFPGKHFHTTPSASLHFVHPTTMEKTSSKENRSLSFLPTLSPSLHAKSEERIVSSGNNSAFNKTFLSIKQRSNENFLDTKDDLLSHFHKVVNGTDGVKFSVKSGRKHHKDKHSKKDYSIDVEDLGDADFDIMMSNDIPHKDFPKKAKGHKHTMDIKEKEHGMKTKYRGKDKKKNKKEGKENDDDDSEESEEKSSTSHSQKEDKSKERKNLHHRKTDHGDDNDDENHSSKDEDDRSKNKRTRSHHSKHKSNSKEQNVIESGHHHKKHKHKAMAAEKDDNNDGDDNYSVKRVEHKKKHHENAKTEGDSKDAGKTERRHHRHHKTHVETFDDNNWVGKIIPGKVKVMYVKNSSRKRHRKHKIQHEKKETRRIRQHKLKARENRKDDSEETEVKNSHSRTNHKHDEEDDEYKKREKHTRYHKDREEDERKEKAKKEDNEGRQEDAEKSTDVNYEAVKTDHKFHHEEDDESRHREEQEKHREKESMHHHHDRGDDEDNSSKSKYVDRDDDNDERQKSNDRKNDDDDNDDKEKHHREKAKENRVVLGEDSESEDEDGKKHSEQSERRHHEHHHHGNERGGDERENVRHHSSEHKSQYSEDYHKPSLHNRHHHERHWESKPLHHESHFESKERDNDDNDVADDRRRNFRKSFIYHKKEDEERRSRQHHDSTRNREEQRGRDMNANSEHHNEDHDREFNANEHHRHSNYHHRHHRYKPRVSNDRKEEKDLYELNGVKYYHEVQHDEPKHFPRHHKTNEERESEESHHDESESFHRHHQIEHRPTEESEDDYRNFQREKEAHRAVYVSHEDDRDGWKSKKYHDRYRQGDSHQRQQQDSHDHRFIGDNGPPDHFHFHPDDYNERRKFKPKLRKKGEWKHRQRYHKKEHQYEDSGGSLDASSWNPNEESSWNPSENYNDDSYYGGEGNYQRKKHWRKHWKHKHRKDRQSYDYWGYGDQNPYYYNNAYHKSRSPYEKYPPQPGPPLDWHDRYKSYNRWKPKPSNWYPAPQHWEKKESWRHHPKWRQFQENRPTGYQWNKYYNDNSNGDERDVDQPKPTSNPGDWSRFFPPTSTRWQQPDTSGRSFRENHWPLGQNRGPDKHYQSWSQSGPSGPLLQDESGYRPQEHPPYGAQPRPRAHVSRPNGEIQPTAVYVPPASQQIPSAVGNQTRFRPTVRRQYVATPPVSTPTNTSGIKTLMNKLNSPPSASGGQQPSSVPKPQNKANIGKVLPKVNLTNNDQEQDRNRLNGFFKEENAGKKSNILRPANSSKRLPTRNSSSANTSHHAPQNPPKATLPPQTTQATNNTTVGHTTPMQKTSNHTSKPSKAAQNISTTAVPTHKSTTTTTPAAPDFGDVSQADDSPGKKHRKHRAPVCTAEKTTDDLTLLRGKRAGNFTNIGDIGDFGMCIKRCCQAQNCDLAFKSAETCFLVSCFSQESCQTSPAIDDIFSPQMSFVKRHSRDSDKDNLGEDGDDEWNDKVSPSGIHEVCDAERALGILWKKTIAGDYSTHPCPRDAKGFVKRRCEADSRWLPPDFSDCISKDYQTLYDKSKKLANGADPSTLIRELSQLTTQNIDNSLIFGGDLNRATDIMAALVQHIGQTELLEMTGEDVENFVRASSNLLDMTNQQEWFHIQKNKPGTADVLRSTEMFALQAAIRLPREDMAEPIITDNIVIKMDRKLPGDGGLTFPDFSNPKIDRWDARHDVIALPSSVFDRREVNTASISFKSLPYLLPDSNVSTGLGPNSKVISTVMHPHPQERINPPVTVVLSHIKRRRGNPKCVFWDYTLNPHRGGAWSSHGCWLAFSNQSHSICQCSHLSNFAVLMDLSSDESLQKEQKREKTMALMWIGIPVLIVGVIGGLYMSFSWNRKSGIPSSVTRPSTSLNEKTGLLGQRVVTSQVREEFQPSPTRDLYRALSPGYSPTGDLEWQDEFDFDVESGDHGFKQMLLPKLQLLQNQLINEFYDADKLETKKKLLLEYKFQGNPKNITDTPVEFETVPVVDRQTIQAKPQIKIDNPIQNGADQSFQQMKISDKKLKLRVRFADESPPGLNRTDEDKERFRRLQRMERRVFAQHLSRWTANSHLNLSAE